MPETPPSAFTRASDSLREQEDRGERAFASVMGPDNIQALAERACSAEFTEGGTAPEQLQQYIEKVLTDIVAPEVKKVATGSNEAINNARITLLEEASKHTAAAASNVVEAKAKFLKTNDAMVALVKKINNQKKQIAALDTKVQDLTVDLDSGEIKVLTGQNKAKVEQLDAATKRAKEAKKDAEAQLFALFDCRLGGAHNQADFA